MRKIDKEKHRERAMRMPLSSLQAYLDELDFSRFQGIVVNLPLVGNLFNRIFYPLGILDAKTAYNVLRERTSNGEMPYRDCMNHLEFSQYQKMGQISEYEAEKMIEWLREGCQIN